MQKYADVILAEHVVLKELIGEIVQAGPFSSEGKQKLLVAEDLLLSHLEKEESYFYPMLYEAASSNPRARQAMDRLHGQAVTLSMDFLYFFQQLHSGTPENILQITFDDLLKVLMVRIEEEDGYLLSLLRELEEAS